MTVILYHREPCPVKCEVSSIPYDCAQCGAQGQEWAEQPLEPQIEGCEGGCLTNDCNCGVELIDYSPKPDAQPLQQPDFEGSQEAPGGLIGGLAATPIDVEPTATQIAAKRVLDAVIDGRQPSVSDAQLIALAARGETENTSRREDIRWRFDMDILTEEHQSILTRDDGATLMYAGKVNSIYGLPGTGKTWVALMVSKEVISSGGRVLWWDFEDGPRGLLERSLKIGFNPIELDEQFEAYGPELSLNEFAQGQIAQWLLGGEAPGLVVIDSVGKSGCPDDGKDIMDWYFKVVYPFEQRGIGVLLVDHVPKNPENAARGAIGSQRKLANITGSALLLQGRAWTKQEGGSITAYNHKDRNGDLPAGTPEPVALIRADHDHNQAFKYSITAPVDRAARSAQDLEDDVLEFIAGDPEGVTGGVRRIREDLGSNNKAIQGALTSLTNQGLIEVVADEQDKRRKYHRATAAGLELLSV